MTYAHIVEGTFLDRPNRFIANVIVDGKKEVCHVKNTGRCRELLIPGASVYLQHCCSPTRKTQYDLIAVKKGDLLINMDSQAPNQVAAEYLSATMPDLQLMRPEITYGNSRVDFYLETSDTSGFVEVKGCTLEQNGRALFPDAPTLRGVKHMEELIRCRKAGYYAMILFIIQMKGVTSFSPNDITHPLFGETLRKAAAEGVEIRAVDCIVTPDTLIADQLVPVVL